MSEAEEEYSTLTVVQLRALCKERGLKVGGVKKDIVNRLIESDNDVSNDNEEDLIAEEETNEEVAASMTSPTDTAMLAIDNNTGGDEESATNDNIKIDDDKSPTAAQNETTDSAAAASSPLPSASLSLPRSGVAEDAELLAELKAISNKSSSGRFLDQDDNTNDDLVEEVESLDQNCSNGNNNDATNDDDNEIAAAHHDHDGVVTDADENGDGQEYDNDDEFDDDAFLPNAAATVDVENEDQFLMENHDIVDNQNVIVVDKAEPNVAEEQYQSNDEADMPVEATVEQLEDCTNNNAVLPSSDDVHDGQPSANISEEQEQVSSPTEDDTTLLAEVQNVSVQSSTSRVEDESNNNEEEDPNKSVRHDADDNIQQEDEIDHPSKQENMGIKSSLPNTFNGKNGGIAEDADLLAELRAISNKTSVSRFEGDDDGDNVQMSTTAALPDDNDDEIAVVVKGAGNEAASTSPVEEEEKHSPPRDENNPAQKNDADVVNASAPAPAPIDPFGNVLCDEKNDKSVTNSAPYPLATEENHGIKSSLPNTFNGKNGGAAEDADLLAELRAISNKSSGGRFDNADESSPNEEVVEKPNDTLVQPSAEEKKGNAHTPSEHLPPWKQQRDAKKKQPPNSFDVDIVVAAPPAPSAVVQENDIDEQQQNNEPPPVNNLGIKSSLPNTFNGKNGGAAEDAALLAELRAISNKTSVSRFDGEEDDGNAQAFSREVEENVTLPSTEEKTLPPWRKNAAGKAKKTFTLDVDVVVAAAPAPAKVDPFQNAFVQGKISEPEAEEKTQLPTEVNPGIKTSLPNTFNGKNGGIAEDADLLAELRAISNKASGNRFDGEEVDESAQSSANEQMNNTNAVTVNDTSSESAPPAGTKKSKRSDTSRPLPPWKRKGAATKKNMSSTAFNVDVVVAAPPASAAMDKPQNQNVRNEFDESSACVNDEPPSEAMGIKSSLPNTFNGKNGGGAEDADLRAELRAISMKNSSSRFRDSDDDNEKAEFTVTAGAGSDQSNGNPLPPKRTVEKKPLPSDFDVAVAAPPAPAVIDPFENAMCNESFVTAADEKEIDAGNGADELSIEKEAIAVPATENMGIKSSLPNTFNGKNGGIAEDADLLAELRAISNKTSASRFEGDDDGDNVQASATAIPPVQKNEAPRKQMNSVKKDAAICEVDVVVAAPATVASQDNNASKDQFRDNGNENVENSSKLKSMSNDDKPWKKKSKERASGSLPPWKVKREKNSFGKGHAESVPDPFQNALMEEENPSKTQSSRDSSHAVEHVRQSNTFSGKNGGAAEDADLLAELQAISSKSSARFVDTDAPKSELTKELEDNCTGVPLKEKAPEQKVKNAEIDVVVSAPPNREPKEENMGIKSSLPSTFKGNNGGAAEDADLVAELRAISMKNSSNRFSDEGEEKVTVSASDAPTKPKLPLEKPWQKKKPSKKDESRPLPPWKQKGAGKKTFAADETNITVAAPLAESINATAGNFNSEPKEEVMGIKSQFTNTFKGDRGGSAEDADLLAELRAISKNSSSNRFTDTDDLKDTKSNNPQSFAREVTPKPTATQPLPAVQNTLQNSGGEDLSAMNPFPTASTPAAAEINITLDGLDESLASSNWQIRKASYMFLQEKILAVLSDREPGNQLSGGDVYSSLDDAIVKALSDKNAGALDAALTLSVTYSDCCESPCSEDTASQIMSLLLKGAAFASSRPSTLKTTQELVFKLVEVAPEGSPTADNIVDLIQQYGLKAKKPKVVNFSASLVLKLVQGFGTSVFNVSKLSAVHETLVGSSNDKIRAIGIEILAELCRTFASKAPLQALVDKLKKSQQSQLDALLDKQSTATPPSRRLRCMRGVKIATQSPEEALAALKKKEEEEKLKRFATRPAVNLLQVLPQTCYTDKIKEVKWSEKVAALDALIEAGGEQPYKILDGNYSTLLRELKQLLSHTHYLVCSKALAAIGMLAEGVGEPISSDIRPLLTTIVPLFKDKKVGKAVMSCLDQMFGNALRFDHLFGNNDSFISSLDEKKEKNALVRKSVLEFLCRCVVSSGTDGKCGRLTSQHAHDLCKIACDKLKDSDASTRKAATDVVISLLSSKDEVIVSTAEKVTSSLQSSNPRAFKTLALATKRGKPDDTTKKGVSRPGTAPLKATSSQSKKPGVANVRPTTAPKSKPTNASSAPAKNAPSSGPADKKFDDTSLPSLDESIDGLSGLGIPRWSDDADNGGVLAGIQCKISSIIFFTFSQC